MAAPLRLRVRAQVWGPVSSSEFLVVKSRRIEEARNGSEKPCSQVIKRRDCLDPFPPWGVKLLLVDDDRDTLQILTVLLREQQANVEAAVSVAEALKCCNGINRT